MKTLFRLLFLFAVSCSSVISDSGILVVYFGENDWPAYAEKDLIIGDTLSMSTVISSPSNNTGTFGKRILYDPLYIVPIVQEDLQYVKTGNSYDSHKVETWLTVEDTLMALNIICKEDSNSVGIGTAYIIDFKVIKRGTTRIIFRK